MSGDVSDFVSDNEAQERPEFRTLNKGQRTAFMMAARNRAETLAAPETKIRKAQERSDSRRDVPMTLPKLKFLDEPENEL
jgi:hypothetical protein